MLAKTEIDPATKYRACGVEGYCSRTSVRPGEKIAIDEYYRYIFEHTKGLPEKAAEEGMTPLEYMRKYGAFEVEEMSYNKHLNALSEDELKDAEIDDETGDDMYDIEHKYIDSLRFKWVPRHKLKKTVAVGEDPQVVLLEAKWKNQIRKKREKDARNAARARGGAVPSVRPVSPRSSVRGRQSDVVSPTSSGTRW